jgi:hypothetical protein
MALEMEKVILLAVNLRDFIQYVQKSFQENNKNLSNPDQLYRLKHLVDEFKFHIIADELIRINKFQYDEKYTMYLINEFKKGITIIGDYIDNNHDDLFIFSARLFTLNRLGSFFQETSD